MCTCMLYFMKQTLDLLYPVDTNCLPKQIVSVFRILFIVTPYQLQSQWLNLCAFAMVTYVVEYPVSMDGGALVSPKTSLDNKKLEWSLCSGLASPLKRDFRVSTYMLLELLSSLSN